jgi:hypothetical protein
MKKEAREEARRLRRDEGLSVKEISDQLHVSRSSVSLWVRDIELTDQQRLGLKLRNPVYAGQHHGAAKNRAIAIERRRQYQEEGRIKARERDPLHIAGCMLYWGEGTKDKVVLDFSNSDAAMMQFYMRFLRESLHIIDADIVVRISCYLGNGLTLNEIEKYWLDLLALPSTSLRKSMVNVQPSSSQQKGRKLKYGTVKVSVFRNRCIHHVLGAIQEYAGIEKPEWLF